MGKEIKHFYEFGPYRIDPSQRLLLRDGRPVQLQPKAFETLLVLVQNSEKAVLKDELMKALWPDSFVEESNLSQNIFVLRKALGDTGGEYRYIVTLPGRGYLFAARVRVVSEEDGGRAVRGRSGWPLILELVRSRGKPIWVGVALFLVLAAGIAYRRHVYQRIRQGGTIVPTTLNVNPRRSVAVLGFHNLSGRADESWLSTALSEMLSTELAAGEHLRILPAEEIARARVELPLADADSLSKSTLAKLRKNLGSDVVVIGSYTVIGEKSLGRIRLDLRLQDAVTGETTAEVAVAGTEADLFDLVSQVGARLREKLGVEAVSETEAASVRASLPLNPEAARLYAEGLVRLRIFDALLARDLLHEAVASDPTYPLSHSGLALAWSALGYDGKAKEEAQRAFSLSRKLSREDQLLVEADYREVTKDWPRAVESYRALYALFPDNLDYGLHLVHAQASAANPRDAQSTLDSLRKLPPPALDDPRIDLAEVSIAWVLGDSRRALAAASRAATKAEARGARLLLARARREQGAAWRLLGENAKALASYAEAKEIFAAAGDQASTASILRDVADTTAEQGDYSLALGLYRQSLDVARKIGSKSGMAADLNNMAVVFENRRDFVAAQRMYERALALYREVGDTRQATLVLGNVGETLFYQGELAGAESRYRQAIAFDHQIGNTDDEAYELSNTAILMATRGDLSGAKSIFERALSLWRDNDIHASSAAMLALGEVQLAQGDLASARRTQEEALSMRQKLGEKGSVAESRLALAAISLEEGRAAEVEPVARDAAAEFEVEKVPDLEGTAYALLARSLSEQGKPQEAQKAVKSAMSFSAKSQEPMIRLAVAITNARVCTQVAVDGNSRTFVKATRDLQSIFREAKKFGYVGLEFETRLALLELKKELSGGTRLRQQFTSLEDDARAKGYGLIARKAAALSSSERRLAR